MIPRNNNQYKESFQEGRSEHCALCTWHFHHANFQAFYMHFFPLSNYLWVSKDVILIPKWKYFLLLTGQWKYNKQSAKLSNWVPNFYCWKTSKIFEDDPNTSKGFQWQPRLWRLAKMFSISTEVQEQSESLQCAPKKSQKNSDNP